MPWTGPQFALKNGHLSPPQAAHAARIANAILARGAPESTAIRIANSHFMRRDAGGGVDPTQGGIGGITPTAQTQSPFQQGMIQNYASLPTEKLQELAARAGGSPQGAMIRAVLQRKLTQPNSQPQAQPQQPQPLISAQPPPTMFRGGPVPRYAAGGATNIVVPPTGSGAPVSSTPMGPTGSSITPGFAGADIGPIGRTALSAAGFIPGPVGMVANAASLGLRGYNAGQVDNALSESGLPGLSAGQTIGAMLGPTIGNPYGSGTNASVQGAIAAAGGNTQSAGSPGFSVGAASGADGRGGIGPSGGPPGGGIGQSNGGGGEYARGGPMLHRAFGGADAVPMSAAEPWWARREASSDTAGAPSGGFGGGFLAGTTGGRTDAVKTTAPGGAYVVPSDVIAGLSDGNSLAGAKVMDEVLRTLPYGISQQPKSRGMGAPRPPAAYREGQGFKAGGVGRDAGKPQPVALSHGEYVISPSDVLRIGRGNMKLGWKLLDEFVLETRKKTIDRLKKLPGPVGSQAGRKKV